MLNRILKRTTPPARGISFAASLAAVIVALAAVLMISSCVRGNAAHPPATNPAGTHPSESRPADPPARSQFINSDGNTIESRFAAPRGFTRVSAPKGSFAEYLRCVPLKPDGAAVHYYDGRVKPRDVAEAVLDVDVGERDLQQCADAIMRLRAEYLYERGKYDDIHFNFANGFRAEYAKWRNGYRITVTGNDAAWVRTAAPSDSHRDFRKYLDLVFAYANTTSLAREMAHVEVAKMGVGDVFIDQGHSIIVVDMAEDAAAGKKVFMLAQSYMPAQEIHILKNTGDPGLSPWYDLDFGDTLQTPEWTFTSRDLKGFK